MACKVKQVLTKGNSCLFVILNSNLLNVKFCKINLRIDSKGYIFFLGVADYNSVIPC